MYASLSALSITPVLSTSNSRYFALHIWKIPENESENYSIVYGVASGNSLSTVYNWTQTGTFPNHLLNFSMKTQRNIQTPFDYVGEPYYYGVGVKSANGNIVRTVVFGSMVSNHSKMKDYEFLSFISLSVFLVFITSIVGIYLCITPKNAQKIGRIRKFLIRGVYRPKYSTSLERFKGTLSAALLLSVPFVLITSIVVYVSDKNFYGGAPDIAILLSYSLAAFMTSAFAASLTVLVIQSRLGNGLRLFTDNVAGKTSTKILAWISLYFIAYFYILLIINSEFLSFFINSTRAVEKLTIILYSINPLSYLWLLGSYLSKSLAANGLFTFDPSSISLSPTYIASIGITWIILLIILPWAIFKKRDESRDTTTV